MIVSLIVRNPFSLKRDIEDIYKFQTILMVARKFSSMGV